MDVIYEAEKKMVTKVIDAALDKVAAKKDITEFEANAVINIMDKFLGGHWRPEVAAEPLKRMLLNRDSKWHHFFERLVENCDRDMIRKFLITAGYEGVYRGELVTGQYSQKYGCNIPFIMLMDPTSACNMKCKGCWAAEYNRSENLSFEVMDRVLTEAEGLGLSICMFTGGEPLIRKNDVIKLCENHPDILFQCFTNSTLVDEELCKDILRVKNLLMVISIEGSEESNDDRRGEGHYKAVEKAMKLMKDNGIPFEVSICYTSQNYKQVTSDEFIDMLIDRGAYMGWYFHYMPVGQHAVPELMPTPEQRKYMIHRIRELRAGEGGKEMFLIDFQNDAEYVGGCIAGGRRYCHINSAGYVEPCVFIHYSSANVNEMSFLDCLKQPLFQRYHDTMPFNDNHFRPCPMLENPEFLNGFVKETGAKSTDYELPEEVDDLTARCMPYANMWAPIAEEEWIKHINK